MKRRVLSSVVCLSTFLSSIPFMAFAQGIDSTVGQATVIYQKSEIRDVDKLFERAKNGISDIESDKEINGETIQVLKNKEGKKRDVKLYRTTQKLKEIKLENGEIETQFATTVIASVSRAYDEKRSDSGSDRSVSVKSSSTLYWSNVTVKGVPSTQHQGASGSWAVQDFNISISNRQVELGAVGYSSESFALNQYHTYDTPNNTFDFPAPSSFKPVATAKRGFFGVNTKCTVKEISTGDTWSFIFTNKLP